MSTDRRLIEAGFPCHQVGAETKRERGASSALPPLYFLHVWWARRPLTPSRAALLGSILPSSYDPKKFLEILGVSRKQIIQGSNSWTLVGKNAALVEKDGHGNEIVTVDKTFLDALKRENERRKIVRDNIDNVVHFGNQYKGNYVLEKWYQYNANIDETAFTLGSSLRVINQAADPSFVNELIRIKNDINNDPQIPFSITIDNEDMYAYDRAYRAQPTDSFPDITILDPTAGGASIPFESIRLGCSTISNDLNPVSVVVQHATLEYPSIYGESIVSAITKYGKLIIAHVESNISDLYPEQPNEQILDYLYCKMVKCPHCRGDAPLLNSSWLSRKGPNWAVRILIHKHPTGNTVSFEPFEFLGSRGPNGEDPDFSTVSYGVGTCIHCRQAISSDEIKDQACGRSPNGVLKDHLYAIAAVKHQPKVDKKGKTEYYKSGKRAGQPRIEKVTFFRSPLASDLKAIEKSKEVLENNWARWETLGLIPTDKIPDGNDMRPVNFGMLRWCDLFNDRQLLGHLYSTEGLIGLKPEIITKLGADVGRAVITYLQFIIDKSLCYNSKQTRWIPQRASLASTFERHGFPTRWTFGEMILKGSNSGLAWGLSQIIDAYNGIIELLPTKNKGRVKVLHGSAANLNLPDSCVDVVCMDPPYYNNVQYAELSDFFYVWQKRTLDDQYPKLFNRRYTNKQDEAVANPVRDGSSSKANMAYESLMKEIFTECKRVLRSEGIMTVMFTHKSQDAWQTLTQALIESGWTITSTFPVDSEFEHSVHQKDMAAAASSIFIACRPRQENQQTAVWAGFGGTGVVQKVRQAVRDGLDEFEALHLNPVDEMVASYGRALQVLSENWPVLDGDTQVTPIRAMTEASSVVAQYQMTRLTRDRLRFNDLNPEAGFALTLFGIYGLGDIPYDDALSLAKSLNISLENKAAGYMVRGRMTGINPERSARAAQAAEDSGYYAPLVSRGSKLRLVAPDERNSRRLEEPQTEWDLLQGIITAFQEGDIPLVRAYIARHAPQKEQMLIDLTTVWADNIADDKQKREASRLLYGLKL